MGLVLSVKRGEKKIGELRPGIRKKVQRMAADMSEEQLKDFTSTKSSNLPKHVRGSHSKLRNVRG